MPSGFKPLPRTRVVLDLHCHMASQAYHKHGSLKDEVQRENPKTITVTSHWPSWRLKSPALNYLCNRLFKLTSKKTSKPALLALCEGNSPVTSEFPSHRASNAENVSIWWRHNDHSKSEQNANLRSRNAALPNLPSVLHVRWTYIFPVSSFFLFREMERFLNYIVPVSRSVCQRYASVTSCPGPRTDCSQTVHGLFLTRIVGQLMGPVRAPYGAVRILPLRTGPAEL